MNWYYTREPGPEGQILNDEGTPSGMPLSQLLQQGTLPVAVALEVISCLAEILTIAEEDQAVHGDIKPGDVYVAADGAVSLEGYGTLRSNGRAPEGRPQGSATDVYGLGVVLHAALSSEPMGAVPRDRDGHDDAIVDRLLAIDWSDMDDLKGRDPVIHFLCSMLAYEPPERPEPLDVANILSEVAAQLTGPGLQAWAKRSFTGQGAASGSGSTPSIEEVLSAPEELGRVFNKTGQYTRRRQSASAKGECTAFWSRDKIAAMLDDGEDRLADSRMFQRAQDPRDPPAVPDAPGVLRSPKPSSVSPAQPYPDEAPWSPDVTISGHPDDEDLKDVIAKLRRTQEEGTQPAADPPPVAAVASKSVPPPVPVAAQPVGSVGRTGPAPARENTGAKAIPWVGLLIGIIVFLLVLLVTAVGGAAWYVFQVKQESDTIEVKEQVVEEPAASKPSPPPVRSKSRPSAARKKSAPARRTTSRPSTSGSSAGSARTAPVPAPPPAPAPAPSAGGAFEVGFKAMGAEAQLVCGDGQSGRFVGMTRRKFSDVTTCVITIDGARGAVQVRQNSTVICAVSGSAVTCSGA